MAMKRQRGDSWEYTFKKAGVLPKPLYLTFKTEAEGDAYAAKLEALLDRGIVPTEHQTVTRIVTIAQLVSAYMREASIKPKDMGVLGTVAASMGAEPIAGINAKWVDDWITDMKRVERLAPSTIRSKVGALARCTDWGMRKGLLLMPDHPLRTLPKGYAQYNKTDAALAGGARQDIERDRRLEPGEHEHIMAVIEAGVLPRKQRPLVLEHKPAIRLLYLMALESAMRLREMYTLDFDTQVSIPRRTIFLDKTKNGSKRQVPMTTVLVAELERYLAEREIPKGHPQTLLFPWWDGDTSPRALVNLSNELSKLYHDNRNPGIFDAAGCVGLKFHDLRHEAVSRLFERTSLTELEIMKISGHSSIKMLARYANLRGQALAARLW